MPGPSRKRVRMSISLHRWIDRCRSRQRRLAVLARTHGYRQAAFAVLRKLTSLPLIRAGLHLELVEVFTARTSELRLLAPAPAQLSGASRNGG